MTDEQLSISDVTLIARLRNTPNWMREGFQNWKDNVRTYDTAPFEASDRIEQLVATNEALTEQLAAARQDAEEAEAYSEELEKERDDYAHNLMQANNTYTEMHLEIERLSDKLATCEKYRDAYDEMGRIGTQAVRDLEGKLARAEWLLTDAAVQLEAGKIKTRRNRAGLIWQFLEETKGT